VCAGRGGALETVVPGATGALVPDLDARAFAEALSTRSRDRRTAPRSARTPNVSAGARFADEMTRADQQM